MIPDYWQLYLPTRVISGAGVLKDLEKEILATGKRKIFLVTDKVLEEKGFVEKIRSSLSEAELVAVFNEVTPNSEVKQVEKGALLAKESGADYILALGGGSCIDTAKGINIVFSLGGSLLDYEGFGQIDTPLNPMGAIPTTAGTGSEVTQFAIILDAERNSKLSFLSPFITPTLAILDPELTLSLPPSLTATTGMDALGHAIESFVSTSTNPFTQGLAIESCQLIFNNLAKSVQDGKNIESRTAMLLASNLAGMAFSNSMVGCVHALAHVLGGLKNIPHATAVGLLLPYGILFNGKDEGYKSYEDLTQKLWGIKGKEAPAFLAEKVSTLLDKCGLSRKLSQLGIKESDLPAIAEEASVDGAAYTNPREAGPEEMLSILKKAY